MKRIREGNDFNVAWKIFQAGVPVDLSQVIDKKLSFSVFGNKTEHTNYTVSGQTLTIEFPKEVTTVIGEYRLIFEYTLSDDGQSDGDLKRKTDVVAFRIVPFTAEADLDMIVDVSSDVAIAFKGDKGDPGYSAYELWLDAGNVGSHEDYLVWQRAPAVDAAATLDALELEVSDNEDLRVAAEEARVNAETQRNTAEGIRISSEQERNSAEDLREQAEGSRNSAEGLREQAEADRVIAEGIRVTAESEREANEDTRQSQESARVTAEGGRVTAESARVSAEGVRSTAESQRNTNEGTRQSQEAARQTNTATAISNANNAAEAANTAAGLADDARLAIQDDLATKIESEPVMDLTEYNEVMI